MTEKNNPGHCFAQKYMISNCRYSTLNHLVMMRKDIGTISEIGNSWSFINQESFTQVKL